MLSATDSSAPSRRTEEQPRASDAGRQELGAEPEIYSRRFSGRENRARADAWRALCRVFLQRYVAASDTVVDLGAGDGHFLRNIRAARRIAVDVSPHVEALAAEGIETVRAPATELAAHLEGQADVVMMSNFLEHLPDKATLLEVLRQVRRCLAPAGRVIIIQPNIRYTGAAYWDYVDHHIALTEHSLAEALEVSGFHIERLVARFLPYTVKSARGRFAGLTGLYLRLPFLWRIFGQQTLAIARPRS